MISSLQTLVPSFELFNQQQLYAVTCIIRLTNNDIFIPFSSTFTLRRESSKSRHSSAFTIFPSPKRSLSIRDSLRASISHGTSPSRGVSNLRSDEPQAAASSRSGTIKSTAVPWVYGKYGCVGAFRAWRNRGRRQSRFRETQEARLLFADFSSQLSTISSVPSGESEFSQFSRPLCGMECPFFFFLNLFMGNFKRYRKRYLYIGGEEKRYRGDIIEVVNNWRLSERYRSSRRVVVLESAARCLITNCYFPASIFWKKRG